MKTVPRGSYPPTFGHAMCITLGYWNSDQELCLARVPDARLLVISTLPAAHVLEETHKSRGVQTYPLVMDVQQPRGQEGK